MAQAADYFLAAMDRYDEARTRKQQMAMQQEQHALYMQNGLMQLGQAREKIADGKEFRRLIQSQVPAAQPLARDPAMVPAEPVAGATPKWDSSAMQKTLDQASVYMDDFNAARGNSGFGTALSLHPQEDGSYILGAANPKEGGALPLTVDPKDNTSAPLHIAPDNMAAMQAYVQGRIDATGGDPAKMRALARDQYGLQYDDSGNIVVPATDLAAAPTPAAQATAQPTAQVAPQPAAPAPVPGQKTSGSVEVSTRPRFNKATVHDPAKFAAAASDPNLRPDDRDREVLRKLDEDHTYAAGIPLHLRSRVAALGLSAGYFDGNQALNMAQTGFSNMNSVELENAMTALKMNKVQFRKAELDYTNALKYDAKLKQAQLDNYGLSMQVSKARIAASTATAATQRRIALRGASDALLKASGEAFDRWAKKNNIDATTAETMKADIQPALTAAISEQYGDKVPDLMADGTTPLKLMALVDQTVAAQRSRGAKDPASGEAYPNVREVLSGKRPDKATRDAVMAALPKDQTAAEQENTKTRAYISDIAAGVGAEQGIPKEGLPAFQSSAVTTLMPVMSMIGLRPADLRGGAPSNVGFTANVLESFSRLKAADETQRYGDENLMLVAVTNRLSEVPADVEAQQTREVMLRLDVLGRGNNYYHQMVTNLLERSHVKDKDIFATSLGMLDEEIERQGKAAELSARKAMITEQQTGGRGMPWDPAR